MRAGAIVHVEGWEGWRFARDGALVTPDGRTFQPWELQNLQLVVSLARRYIEARKPAPARCSGQRASAAGGRMSARKARGNVAATAPPARRRRAAALMTASRCTSSQA